MTPEDEDRLSGEIRSLMLRETNGNELHAVGFLLGLALRWSFQKEVPAEYQIDLVCDLWEQATDEA